MAFIVLTVVMVQKFMGMNIPGWTAIMTASLFLGGSIHLAIGFLGIYIARVYNESKKRPLYVIQDVVDLNTKDESLK